VLKIASITTEPILENKLSLQLMEQALRLRGAVVERFAIESVAISADPDLPALLHNGKPCNIDGAILGDLGGRDLDVTYTLEKAGIPTLNSTLASLSADHKGRTNAHMKSAGMPPIPVPLSFEVRSAAAGLDAARFIGYPIVIKRSTGLGGEHVRKVVVDTSTMATLQELDADLHDMVVSEYAECGGKAIRIVVINGTAIRVATEHQAPTGEFRTQRKWGATVKIVEPTEAQCQLAETIARAGGHGYVGVDIGTVIASHPSPNSLPTGSLVLFETNSLPALPKLTEDSGYDFPGVIVDMLLAKIDHWKQGGTGNPPNWRPPQPGPPADDLDQKRSA
jgi:glutathione synthase/RimK-type ligase-like ATP-grasp enzyme